MATALDLDLRPGDIVRLGTPVYRDEHVVDRDGRRGTILEGLDMTRGPRVKVLETEDYKTPPHGRCVSVVYLDPDTSSLSKRGPGFVCSIWGGYEGFIPDVQKQG